MTALARTGNKQLGRPSGYTPEILEKASMYLESFDNIEEGEEEIIPSHAGLAEYLNISRVCMYTWAKEEGKEDFSYMLKRIKNKQEYMLLSGGLKNKYNSTITKLMLSKHGYHDKADDKAGLSITINIDRDCQSVTIDGTQNRAAISSDLDED